MATKAGFFKLAPLPIAVAAVASVMPAQASAEPLPYGPDTCVQGLVWREARTGDTVCVTPAFRAAVAQQNSTPQANKDPNAGSGPESCSQGYVWREAFDGDVICVTPDLRQANWDANAAAESNYQRNQPSAGGGDDGTQTVRFEVFGGKEVYAIVTDPDTGFVPDHTPLPWSLQTELPPDDMYQVVATGRDSSPGCRITIDGVVVAEQPVGGSSHCIYTP